MLTFDVSRERRYVPHPCLARFLQCTILATIFGLLLSNTSNGQETSETVAFDIPALSIPEALQEFARQARVELAFSERGFEGIRANPVVGNFRRQHALQLLLDGTGLSARLRADDSVVVQRARGGTQAPSSRADTTNSRTLLLAQTEPDGPTDSAQSSNLAVATAGRATPVTDISDQSESQPQFEEIVVTGTRIRGAGAAGTNVITLDRAEIELTGFATTQEVLRSIPQNFGAGANEVTQNVAVGPFVPNNGFASSVNLRGLGTESTLLLINGRRSAPGGGIGAFVDLNSIPATAIERVEILADGASAIYGSEAIGGVINVILRDDYEGAESRLRYAPGTSDIDELQFSQLFGKRWSTGNVLFTYEYYDRSELKSEDRAYARDSDLTNLGGSDHSVPISNPGNITSYTLADGTTMNVQSAIPEGQDGTTLTPSDLLSGATNLQNTREGTTLLPSQERHSAALHLSQGLLDEIELFANIRYSTRDFENRNRGVSSPFSSLASITVPSSNPFFVDQIGGSTALRMNYSFVNDYGPSRSSGTVDTLGSTLGVTFNLNDTWDLEIYGSYNSEDTATRRDRLPNTVLLAEALADPDPETAFNPFGDGSFTNPATLAAVEGFTTDDVKSELTIFNLSANGDLFDMPGGPAKLAVGGQFGDQALKSTGVDFLTTPGPVPGFPTELFKLDRDVTAVFAELYLPLVTNENARTGIESLAVSIAGRYEDYSDFGDTFNPKFGVSWSLTDSFTLRSTYGTSFRAPLLTELDDSQPVMQAFGGVPDPVSPTGSTTVIFKFGNNADLLPEEGRTLTAGFDITPADVPGLKIGLTYFTTEVEDLIALPGDNLFQPLSDPAFAAIVQRVPDDIDVATVAEILLDPNCFFCSSFDPADIGAVVDFRLNNLTELNLSGLDLDLAYGFENKLGVFNLALYASHLFEFQEQAFLSGPLNDNIDTFLNPNSLKLRGTLTWMSGGTGVALFVNHIGDYTTDFSDSCAATAAGYCRVASWTTWDLNVSYDFGEHYAGLLEGTKVSLNIRNVFDDNPPFVEVDPIGVGFDPFAHNPWGRFLALQLTKEW